MIKNIFRWFSILWCVGEIFLGLCGVLSKVVELLVMEIGYVNSFKIF